MSPAGLSNGVVDALIKASPQVLFLMFGRRSILSSATTWQSILYPPIFVRAIDLGLNFLFKWHTKNISMSQKLASYPHLYSFTSTKSVVHWFQIIRTKSFQMYDDDVHPPLLVGSSSKYTKVAKYPTRNIKTPIVLVYGGSDSLVDIKVMLRELPPQTVATEIPHYEHLDFLWARDVDTQVFKHVFDALESFTDAEHSREEYARYRMVRQESLSMTAAGSGTGFAFTHRREESDVTAESSDVATAVASGHDTNSDDAIPSPQPHRAREPPKALAPATVAATVAATRNLINRFSEDEPSSPEGPDWPVPVSGLEGPALDDQRLARHKGHGPRRGSGASRLSLDGIRDGRGIKLGAARAVGGVVTVDDAEGLGLGSGADDGATAGRKRR